MKSLSLLAALLLAAITSATAQHTPPDVPQITAAFINKGSPQRSMIQTIGVRFDRNAADLVQQGALHVRNIDTGAMVDLTNAVVRFDPKNNTASWIIDRKVSALLPDGNFIAWFDTGTLVSERGRASCAASATPLDDFTFGFHQRSGDADGDRDVDFKDSCVLRESWQQKLGAPRYLSYLDFNISDLVEETDRRKVADTYFTVFPAGPAVHLFLRNDTGDSFNDNATSLYNFAFDSVATTAVANWRISLDGRPATDITSQVPGGSAILDEAFIDSLNGGPLAVGSHTLRVEAVSSKNVILAADQVIFEYLGDVACAPYFITSPPPGVSLGSVRSSIPLNLANWTVENYPGDQGPSRWVIAPDGLSVEQQLNSRPSALISDQSFVNLRITGRFRVDTGGDDDFIGFIFGYQNSDQFYLFDWKQNTQSAQGGRALRGMTIKRIDAKGGSLTTGDFWESAVDKGNVTILSPSNDIPWKHFQDYDITLEFRPGSISVEVREEGILLDRLEAADATFAGGRFGFYNNSQDSVIYRGFTAEKLDNQYFYDAEAEDPDGGAITYSFANSPGDIPPPDAATINAANGAVLWQPTVAGSFPFTIVATDSDGLTDTQTFNVNVTPIDLPPTIVIRKTASSVFPGEEVGIQAIATDDQQIFRTRLFIDDVEVDPNRGETSVSTNRTFTKVGQVELRAIAIDSADQLSETVSYIRVLDPIVPPPDNPNQTPVNPPGIVTGNPTDIRPLVSFQAPLNSNDDPTRFVGTIDANGGTLANWFLEWAPAARTVPGNLADPSVLWQEITRGATPQSAALLATIVPGNFPNELITFRLRAENSTGLGAMAAITYNPRSASNSTTTAPTGAGTGARPIVAFTAPLSPVDDFSMLRGTVGANGGTLRNWSLDYAPVNRVNKADYNDPSVVWTVLHQDSAPVTDALLATMDPDTFPAGVLVFRLRAENTNGAGALATLTYNPTATGFTTPGDTNIPTGNNPASADRPIARIDSPRAPADDQSVLIGSVLANGGTLDHWIVDYATRTSVNPADLSDPSVAWTLLAQDSVEKSSESLATLANPVFDTGVWVVRLRAFNSNGLGSLSSTLLDSGDQSVPTVNFTSPEPDADVTYIIPVTGSITSGAGTLASWKLEYAPAERVSLTNLNAPSTAWVQIGSGTEPLHDQPLGSLDATLLRNGSYVLRLSAFNNNGRGFTDGRLVNVSGEAKLGNFRLTFEDLNLPLGAIPIRVKRIYDTLDANRKGDFGFGWTLALSEADIRETVPDTGSDFFDATPFRVGTRVFITNPDGKRIGFTFNVRNPRVTFNGTAYQPYLEPDPGVYESLAIAPSDYEQVELDPSGEVFQILLPFGYNPDHYRLTTKDGLVYDYDQRSGLKKITDSTGQNVTFAGDSIVHSNGQKIAILRDGGNRITSITGPNGEGMAYAYDSNGDLVSVANAENETTRFNYINRPAHYLDSYANPADAARGRITQRVIYENGRFSRIEDADGNPMIQQEFDPDSFTGTDTDADGNVTTSIYDKRGNITKIIQPSGATTIFEFNDPENPDLPTAIIDANGLRTTKTYNRGGNIVREVCPSGIKIENDFGPHGQLTAVRQFDSSGQMVVSETNVFNPDGNLLSTTRGDGRSQSYDYNEKKQVRSFKDFDGNEISFTYGTTSPVPTKVTYPNGHVLNLETDSKGNVTKISSGAGISSKRIYDLTGRLLSVANSNDSSKTFAYDQNGNITKTVDSLGRVTTMIYDDHGHLTRQSFSKSGDTDSSDDPAVIYGYDGSGRLTALTDPAGNRTEMTYNADGRLVERKSPDGSVVTATYDPAGRVLSRTDERGLTRSFVYNDAGNVLQEKWLDTAGAVVRTITSEYNEFERLTSISDPDSAYHFTYDNLWRNVGIANTGTPGIPEVNLTYVYGDEIRPVSTQDNLGAVVDYGYDAGRKVSGTTWTISGNPVASTSFTRNPRGEVTGISRRTGGPASQIVSRTVREFSDVTGLLDSIKHLTGSGLLVDPDAEFDYHYDSEGQIIARARGSDTLDYSYDDYGQLTGATDRTSGSVLESYQYDSAGNRTRSHLFGVHVTGANNRLDSNDRFDYSYDAAGNLIEKIDKTNSKRTRLEWDHRNRNTRVQEFDAADDVISDTKYRYDVDDRIIETISGSNSVYTVWDGIHPWVRFRADGTPTQRFLYGGDVDEVLASWTPADGITWYAKDSLGNVGYELDSTGGVAAEFHYDSFGNILGVQIPGGPSFNARPEQADGLLNFRARLYDPTIGRFVSADPLGFGSKEWNLYRYVRNSPLRGKDPFGTSDFTIAGQLVATGTAGTLLNIGYVAGARAIQYAANAYAAGLLGALAVEFTDYLLSTLPCTEARALTFRDSLESIFARSDTIAGKALDNVRTSAIGSGMGFAEKGLGLAAAPLAYIYGFYTGPIYDGASTISSRTRECIRKLKLKFKNSDTQKLLRELGIDIGDRTIGP